MVTAGVYLIARLHALFTLAPVVQHLVAIIGVVTLLTAGLSALTQRDIKRILAYSTMSQVGYMFLALGVGAWTAAIFHFMTHAFFKALLFLCAGVIIQATGGEHDIFKMGGLRGKLPLTFWAFLAGTASLSSVPLVTAGFYSKELILVASFASRNGSPWLLAAGVVGVCITSAYAFRMLFFVFFGDRRTAVNKMPCLAMTMPMVILAVFSLVGGFVEVPLAGIALFSGLMDVTLPHVGSLRPSLLSEGILLISGSAASLFGIYLGYYFFFRKPSYALMTTEPVSHPKIHLFLFSGWGFDWLYHRCFVLPFMEATRLNRNDVLDGIYQAIARLTLLASRSLVYTQRGRVRSYGAAILLGAVIFMGLILFL
jgi:NADH-quinone oxidoreductase subunit L